jgi:hypothetical protein
MADIAHDGSSLVKLDSNRALGGGNSPVTARIIFRDRYLPRSCPSVGTPVPGWKGSISDNRDDKQDKKNTYQDLSKHNKAPLYSILYIIISPDGALHLNSILHLKSKNQITQVNELLAKIIAYNLTVVIHEIYENGISPDFLNKGCGNIKRELIQSEEYCDDKGKYSPKNNTNNKFFKIPHLICFRIRRAVLLNLF